MLCFLTPKEFFPRKRSLNAAARLSLSYIALLLCASPSTQIKQNKILKLQTKVLQYIILEIKTFSLVSTIGDVFSEIHSSIALFVPGTLASDLRLYLKSDYRTRATITRS